MTDHPRLDPPWRAFFHRFALDDRSPILRLADLDRYAFSAPCDHAARGRSRRGPAV